MKALTFHAHGGPEVLRVEDVPTPEPGPGEVRIDVKAVALNHLDIFVRKGWPGLKLDMPHWGGCDVAGVVDKVGSGVAAWRPGERVVMYPSLSCGRCRACREGQVQRCAQHRLIGEHVRGGAAEKLVLPAENLCKVPDGFPLDEAAAASLVFLTAWRMLVTRARVRAGETVLVVGSGGGVNSAAIQIAKLAGARVLAVAGGPEKVAAAKALGADEVADYKEVDFSRWAFERTGKEGADVVVDNVGAATWTKSLKAVARGGRIVTVGGTTGYEPPAGINYVFWKEIEILGSTMGTRREFETVMDLVYRGRLKSVLSHRFPLDQAVEATRVLEAGEAFGKVVIEP
ncbi:MAG TPA: zinc-binding dehydrogenase [Candidatus Thermoplasmatota archaeon]|nr:zinc-binding dehydrogenase [Candidatus Thermoplasmatota archaeon]